LKGFLQRILPAHLGRSGCVGQDGLSRGGSCSGAFSLGEMFGLLDDAEEKGLEVDLQEVVYAYAMSVFGELAYDVGTELRSRRFSP
jgi:hypothetical protein